MHEKRKKSGERANAHQTEKARPNKEPAVLRVTSLGPNVKRIERLWLVEREVPGGNSRACLNLRDATTWANFFAAAEPGNAYIVRVFVPERAR